MFGKNTVSYAKGTSCSLGDTVLLIVPGRADCGDFTKTVSVKTLVRWATGKRLTNRLPKLSLTTLQTKPYNSPPGTDRKYRLTFHQHVVPISGDPTGSHHYLFNVRIGNVFGLYLVLGRELGNETDIDHLLVSSRVYIPGTNFHLDRER